MITLVNFPNSRAFRRSIEKKVVTWIGSQNSSLVNPRFHAILSKEGDGHEVACEVQVLKDDGLWEGRYYASGPEQAIRLALKSMRRRYGGTELWNSVSLFLPEYAYLSR
jgi:hypothetical protein